MKKLLNALLALALLVPSALATGAVQFSEDLFDTGKQALSYLSSGEYARLVTLLPFSGVAPSATEWERFAANFTDLKDVQTDYSVAWWTETGWKLAVPAQDPDKDTVEVLVLTSEDGVRFDGYRYALWSQVKQEYEVSDHVVWNQEYVSGKPLVFAD